MIKTKKHNKIKGSQAIKEDRNELSREYVSHIKNKFPELHDDLLRIAKFTIKRVSQDETPSENLENLSAILKLEPDADPRTSGDTHGVRLYIDHLLRDEDKQIAGQVKRWYQSAMDQMLKKQYIGDKNKKSNFDESNIRKYVESVLNEGISSDAQNPVRQPFDMKVPADIKKISAIFKKEGFSLYIVGGAVRDELMGKTPKDYDLATNALPDEILTILKNANYKTLEVGKAFGVVNVITPDKNEYEIATFRKDL